MSISTQYENGLEYTLRRNRVADTTLQRNNDILAIRRDIDIVRSALERNKFSLVTKKLEHLEKKLQVESDRKDIFAMNYGLGELVLMVFQKCFNQKELMLQTLRLLHLSKGNFHTFVKSNGTIRITECLKRFKYDADIQETALLALRAIIYTESLALRVLSDKDILDCLHDSMVQYIENRKIQSVALSLLWRVCVYSEARDIIWKSAINFPALVLATLKAHSNNAKILKYGLSLFNSFDNAYSLARLGYISFFLELLPKVDKPTVKLIFRGLRSLLKCKSTAKVIESRGACSTIVIVIMKYRDRVIGESLPDTDFRVMEFMEESLNLLMKLSLYPKLSVHLIEAQVNGILTSLYFSERFSKDPEMLIRCMKCMIYLSDQDQVLRYINLNIPTHIVKRIGRIRDSYLKQKPNHKDDRNDVLLLCFKVLIKFGELEHATLNIILEEVTPIIADVIRMFQRDNEIARKARDLNRLLNGNFN